MKNFAFLAAILATMLSSHAAPLTLEDISPHLSTNAQIIWKAPTNSLPKKKWIYKKILPRIFSVAVISNAIVLASLQDKGFPQPSTNEICMDYDSCPCGHPCTFSIRPYFATLAYTMPNFDRDSGKDIPSDEVIVKRAWGCTFQLNIDSAQLMQKAPRSHICSSDENGRDNTNNQVCGRGVFLSRLIDGIAFMGNGNDGWETEGFWIGFGSYGKIRAFTLVWPNLERYEIHQTASPAQIINCIRAFKTPMPPIDDEPNYFARVKNLANAKKFTITKITPYYGEGVFGEAPTNNEPPKFVTPFAELEAVADFGNSNVTVRLLSPILSSEVIRILGTKDK
jgi:hypothetical protein